ncbi:MAG: oligopeptide/dipeptide ABC transporter ATP-binding protein [Acidimicrobiales bacterium]|nr:oligopeptide/dipeptide ABC transporter ATP-binding protein [Acidimicrobiales bacterium]
MYLGKLCEVAAPDDLYHHPAHPYSSALLSADPAARPRRRARHQRPSLASCPSPMDPPSGCRFRTRCPQAQDRCTEEEPGGP